MDFYPIRDFAALLGKSPQTLRNWDKSGALKPVHVSPSGVRYYSSDQLLGLLRTTENESKRRSIGYCRIGGSENKACLAAQREKVVSYMKEQRYDYTVIEEVGSSADLNRTGMRELLDSVMGLQVDSIVVTSSDRLCIYGYEFFKQICERRGAVIEVLDSRISMDDQEVLEDMATVVKGMSFSLKVKKANQVVRLLKELMA
jgi:predicted site-specific integrase-resolvase